MEKEINCKQFCDEQQRDEQSLEFYCCENHNINTVQNSFNVFIACIVDCFHGNSSGKSFFVFVLFVVCVFVCALHSPSSNNRCSSDARNNAMQNTRRRMGMMRVSRSAPESFRWQRTAPNEKFHKNIEFHVPRRRRILIRSCFFCLWPDHDHCGCTVQRQTVNINRNSYAVGYQFVFVLHQTIRNNLFKMNSNTKHAYTRDKMMKHWVKVVRTHGQCAI